MQPDFDMAVLDGIVRIRANGEVSAEAGDAMMAAAAEAARNNAASRYILDFRDAKIDESPAPVYGRPDQAQTPGARRTDRRTVPLARAPDCP